MARHDDYVDVTGANLGESPLFDANVPQLKAGALADVLLKSDCLSFCAHAQAIRGEAVFDGYIHENGDSPSSTAIDEFRDCEYNAAGLTNAGSRRRPIFSAV